MDVGLEITASIPGMVPEFECREAAIYVGITWKQWLEDMSDYDRATAVAHYRVQLLIKAHVEDASATASERRAGKARIRAQQR